jgi:hypothetical protein
MCLPGFGAESSLYKTGGHYQMAEGSDHTYGITPQIACGGCYWYNGECVMDCYNRCPPGVKPNGCGGYETVPCRPPRQCPPKPPCCPAGCQGTC